MFQNYLFYFAKRHAKTSFLTLPAPFQKVINLFQRATLLRQGSAPVALRALPYVLRKIRSLEIPSGSFLEFRFKISFSRNFFASLVTRLGALRSVSPHIRATEFRLLDFASGSSQATSFQKCKNALFPFRSAFTLAGYRLRLSPYASFCQNL